MFAADIAHAIGIPRLVIPPFPGIASALGLLASDVRYEEVRTIMAELDAAGHKAAATAYRDLSEGIEEQLRRDGFGREERVVDPYVDCRYIHQGYELTIPAPRLNTREWSTVVRERFEEAHRREFGGTFEDFRVQLVAVRARGRGLAAELQLPPCGTAEANEPRPISKVEVMHLTPLPQLVSTPVYERAEFGENTRFVGPALLEQLDATTIIPPDAVVTTLRDGTLLVELRQGPPSDAAADSDVDK
jgi:N-methylhydantoinase A/oxoprolinase/acetone carboxylase beta subunit